jgi:hypothetical protein
MRAIIEIFLAIVFTVILGFSGMNLISSTVKKESIKKVSGGLGSLEKFTTKMTTP